MSSDVEMLPFHQTPLKLSPTDPDLASPPPPSHSSRTSSLSRHFPLGLDTDTPALVPVIDDDDQLDPQFKKKPSSSAKPGSTAVTKPKSARPRPRSPSPSPPPPPPPLQTVRLEITLGGPDNYEVDISNIAKATGQRPPTPVLAKRDTSDSEPDDDPDKDKPKPKKRKKNVGSEYYDLADPFIDDSELAVDERTYFAQTKQQGFYVSSGEVALLKDKTPKKPKSKRNPGEPSTSATILSTVQQEGTRDSPIALLSEDEDRPGHKRKRYLTIVEGGKKRKIVDVHSFHPDLQAAIDVLKLAISNESWEVKGKFPPAVKPILLEVAVKAIVLDEYDEHFFNLMPILFPYNKFTMTKLIKRTVFADHTRILTERQDALLDELATLTKDGFAKAQEEWEKAVVLWGKKQEKAKAEAGVGAPDAEGASTDGKHADDAGSGMEQDNPPKDATGRDATKEPHPPPRRYRLTDAMKVIVWRLVALSNEVCRLENEKNSLEGSTVQVSEQGLRKVLYQKIVSAFPEGWMSSGQISREVSSMKKRLEKEAMENES